MEISITSDIRLFGRDHIKVSSLVDNAANEQRRGTAEFDCLYKMKPPYIEMRDTCKINFHHGQEMSIDEWMIASKARTGLKHYMKNKHWVLKDILFHQQ